MNDLPEPVPDPLPDQAAPQGLLKDPAAPVAPPDLKTKDTPMAAAAPAAAPQPEVIYALVVDDETANRDFLVRLLQQAKLDVKGASTGAKALQIAEQLGDQLRLVMLDHKLPDMTGAELLVQMRARLPKAKIVMATMYDEPSMIRDAFEKGCNAFLVKPHGFMELFKMVQCVTTDPDCLNRVERLVFDQHGQRRWR